MKFEAVLATNKVDMSGERFTDEALREMAEQAPGCSVTLLFDPSLKVGELTEGNVENGCVVVRGILDGNRVKRMYAVPGFTTDTPEIVGGVKVISEIRDLRIGLTRFPADPHLTPLKRIE